MLVCRLSQLPRISLLCIWKRKFQKSATKTSTLSLTPPSLIGAGWQTLHFYHHLWFACSSIRSGPKKHRVNARNSGHFSTYAAAEENALLNDAFWRHQINRFSKVATATRSCKFNCHILHSPDESAGPWPQTHASQTANVIKYAVLANDLLPTLSCLSIIKYHNTYQQKISPPIPLSTKPRAYNTM